MDAYQEGFKAGYRSAEQFYGLAARERLDRIAEATRACLPKIWVDGRDC